MFTTIDSYSDKAELKDIEIQRQQASELVASPFLKFCKMCGHSVVEKHGWNWEFLEPQKLHSCKETKEERLKHLNRRNV